MSEGKKFNYDKEKERLARKKMAQFKRHTKKLEGQLAKGKEDLEAANARIKDLEESEINLKIAVRDLEKARAEEVADQQKVIDRQERKLKAQSKKLEKASAPVVIVSDVPILNVKWPRALAKPVKKVAVKFVDKGGR